MSSDNYDATVIFLNCGVHFRSSLVRSPLKYKPHLGCPKSCPLQPTNFGRYDMNHRLGPEGSKGQCCRQSDLTLYV